MTKSKKPRKKREPSARVKLSRDLVADRKALRARIRELIKKEKASRETLRVFNMGTKRARPTDEYPEFIRTSMTMPVIALTVNKCTGGAVTLQDWVLPVELDLNQPTFIELNKLVIWLDAPLTIDFASVSATANETATQRVIDIFILNERRTAAPVGDDNAIVMHAVLTLHLDWVGTTTTAQNCGIVNWSKSHLRAMRDYEDNKTGQGLLIAQPRLFLLAEEVMTEGATDTGTPAASLVNFKMEFRLTDRVSPKEFFTEMIAKFS